MASVEGIRSPVPTQPSARSPKLRIYESLFLWNQGVDQLVAILRGMEKLSCADKQSLQFAQVEIEEVRADVNADFVEELVDLERVDEGRFWKQKRAHEKKWRDPDDVYIDVEQREEERKKRDCRHVSALFPIQQWPTKKNASRRNKSRRNSAPKSARSPL